MTKSAYLSQIKRFIFEKKRESNKKYLKILGIKVKEKKTTPTKSVTRVLGIPFNVKKVKGDTIKKYFLGIQYKTQKILPKVSPVRKVNDFMSIDKIFQALSCAETHKHSFSQFKNINAGKDVVIVATGPTLAKYNPIKGAVHIGLNRAYQFDKVKLDYLFMIDGTATSSYIDEIDKLDDVIKFYGLALGHEEYRPGVRIPEYHLLNSKNSYRFYADTYRNSTINANIATYPLFQSGSISFAAIHFALWTHPKRIYLVGCDCSDAPYWDGGKREKDYLVKANKVNNMIIGGYFVLKEFAQRCYPDVEIISINPVGLKGLFTDVYTEGKES